MSSRFNNFYFVLLILATLVFVSTDNFGQVKSRIEGSVIDATTNEPIFGANVVILGTYLGAANDDNGEYFIINVPVGTYRIKISAIGYASQTIQDVIVSANRVTRLDVKLNTETIQSEEVVVTAEKSLLHKEVSNTEIVVSKEQIQEASGVREINSFINRLPGVETTDEGFLTIRGGSADQVGSMVNGLSYVNSAVGNAETSIPLSAIDQVSLTSGGYNAEYGNFRSGLINITTKSGSKDKYSGTFSFSMDNSHQRRFGDSFYDPKNSALRSYLDADVAFVGTEVGWADNEYFRENQYPKFDGWNAITEAWNIGRPVEEQASPIDLYLFTAWMHMAEPDYEGLAKQGYIVSDEHKELFKDHKMKENGSDWNVDAGFGGPIPFISKELGDATFYISHNSKEKHYVMPLTRRSEMQHVTLATIKSTPWKSTTISYNGLWKTQTGLSPIRPPWGDQPNSGDAGGFMPIFNIKYQANNPEYWYDQPLFPILSQSTIMSGITINHVFSPSSFIEATIGYSVIQNRTDVGDNRDTSVVTNFGPIVVDESPYNKLQEVGNHRVGGFSFPSYDTPLGIPRRFRRKEGNLYDNTKTTQLQAKVDYTLRMGSHNYIKAGAEYNYIDIDHNLWEKWNENAYNVYEFNFHRWPSQTGLYIQDQITYKGIVANLGMRMDYYYGGGGLWPSGDPFAEDVFSPQPVDSSLFSYLADGNSYIWDIWREYDKENPGFLQPIQNHLTFSPRIGLSFPVTIDSKFYFNYGQYRSNPPYYTMYQFRYRYDKKGLYDMSNPNLAPPKTISYELGISYNFWHGYIVNIAGYYKDVTGETGDVAFSSTGGALDYDMLMNNNYEDIQGLELTLSKSDNSWFNMWINFNYMLKKSGFTGQKEVNEITLNSTEFGLYNGEESRSVPQPRFNANFTVRSPSEWGPEILGFDFFGNWVFTLFTEWKSGSYFTFDAFDSEGKFVNNNLQWPDYYMIDLKISKSFKMGNVNTTFFVDISNLFNIKVNLFSKGYAFENDTDESNYIASLRLPIFDSPEYDDLREENEGYYIAGDDNVGDLRSSEKPYINDPNRTFWYDGFPRDIWFGLRVDF